MIDKLIVDSLGLVKIKRNTIERILTIDQYLNNDESLAVAVRAKSRRISSIDKISFYGVIWSQRPFLHVETPMGRHSTGFAVGWCIGIGPNNFDYVFECLRATKSVEAICSMWYSINSFILCILGLKTKITIWRLKLYYVFNLNLALILRHFEKLTFLLAFI